MEDLLQASTFSINSWEIILILFLLGGGILLGVLLGRSRIFFLLLGSYISFALITVIPFKKIFPQIFSQEENFVILIVSYLALTALIYLVFYRSFLKSSVRKKGERSLFQVFFLSTFLMGITLCVAFSFFPLDLKSAFSPLTLKIFGNEIAKTIWLIIPLIFISIFRGRKR
ncbi:MAG: hypothetical protein GF387_02160 [Candidatus Portnoybacteria bacterium]|nr:hypothetical protein [Candidatus Portnoybacteria bacterium]